MILVYLLLLTAGLAALHAIRSGTGPNDYEESQ